MAIAFLNDVNLSNNEIQNVVIQRLATDPTGVEGKIIYNNGSNTIKYYNGTSWIELDGLGGLQGSGTVGTIPIFTTNTTTLGNSDLAVTGTGSSSYLEIGYPLVTIKSLYLQSDLKDTNDQAGTAGQLLSSLGSGNGIDWIDAPVSYTKWVLTGDSGTQDVLDGDTVIITGGTGIATLASATDKLTITPAFDEYSTATPGENAGLLFGIDGDMSNSEMRYQEVNGFTLDLFGEPAANISFNSKKIISLSDPTSAQDAATKAYVDTAVVGNLVFQGGYNAATNTPDLDSSPSSSIKKGWSYVVTVAGDFFTEAVEVGDFLISQQDAPTTLANWVTVQNNADLATLTTVGLGNVNTRNDKDFLGIDVDYQAATPGTAFVGLDIKNMDAFAGGSDVLSKGDAIPVYDTTDAWNKRTTVLDIGAIGNSNNSEVYTSASGTTHTFNHNLNTRNVIVQLFDTSSFETVYATVVRTSSSVVTVTTAASADITCLITKIG